MKTFNLTVIVISIVIVVIGITLNIVFGQTQEISYTHKNILYPAEPILLPNNWIPVSFDGEQVIQYY